MNQTVEDIVLDLHSERPWQILENLGFLDSFLVLPLEVKVLLHTAAQKWVYVVKLHPLIYLVLLLNVIVVE